MHESLDGRTLPLHGMGFVHPEVRNRGVFTMSKPKGVILQGRLRTDDSVCFSVLTDIGCPDGALRCLGIEWSMSTGLGLCSRGSRAQDVRLSLEYYLLPFF